MLIFAEGDRVAETKEHLESVFELKVHDPPFLDGIRQLDFLSLNIVFYEGSNQVLFHDHTYR